MRQQAPKRVYIVAESNDNRILPVLQKHPGVQVQLISNLRQLGWLELQNQRVFIFVDNSLLSRLSPLYQNKARVFALQPSQSSYSSPKIAASVFSTRVLLKEERCNSQITRRSWAHADFQQVARESYPVGQPLVIIPIKRIALEAEFDFKCQTGLVSQTQSQGLAPDSSHSFIVVEPQLGRIHEVLACKVKEVRQVQSIFQLQRLELLMAKGNKHVLVQQEDLHLLKTLPGEFSAHVIGPSEDPEWTADRVIQEVNSGRQVQPLSREQYYIVCFRCHSFSRHVSLLASNFPDYRVVHTQTRREFKTLSYFAKEYCNVILLCPRQNYLELAQLASLRVRVSCIEDDDSPQSFHCRFARQHSTIGKSMVFKPGITYFLVRQQFLGPQLAKSLSQRLSKLVRQQPDLHQLQRNFAFRKSQSQVVLFLPYQYRNSWQLERLSKLKKIVAKIQDKFEDDCDFVSRVSRELDQGLDLPPVQSPESHFVMFKEGERLVNCRQRVWLVNMNPLLKAQLVKALAVFQDQVILKSVERGKQRARPQTIELPSIYIFDDQSSEHVTSFARLVDGVRNISIFLLVRQPERLQWAFQENSRIILVTKYFSNLVREVGFYIGQKIQQKTIRTANPQKVFGKLKLYLPEDLQYYFTAAVEQRNGALQSRVYKSLDTLDFRKLTKQPSVVVLKEESKGINFLPCQLDPLYFLILICQFPSQNKHLLANHHYILLSNNLEEVKTQVLGMLDSGVQRSLQRIPQVQFHDLKLCVFNPQKSRFLADIYPRLEDKFPELQLQLLTSEDKLPPPPILLITEDRVAKPLLLKFRLVKYIYFAIFSFGPSQLRDLFQKFNRIIVISHEYLSFVSQIKKYIKKEESVTFEPRARCRECVLVLLNQSFEEKSRWARLNENQPRVTSLQCYNSVDQLSKVDLYSRQVALVVNEGMLADVNKILRLNQDNDRIFLFIKSFHPSRHLKSRAPQTVAVSHEQGFLQDSLRNIFEDREDDSPLVREEGRRQVQGLSVIWVDDESQDSERAVKELATRLPALKVVLLQNMAQVEKWLVKPAALVLGQSWLKEAIRLRKNNREGRLFIFVKSKVPRDKTSFFALYPGISMIARSFETLAEQILRYLPRHDSGLSIVASTLNEKASCERVRFLVRREGRQCWNRLEGVAWKVLRGASREEEKGSVVWPSGFRIRSASNR